MVPFNKEMWVDTWPKLLEAPDSQIDQTVMAKLRNFDVANKKPREIYDFLSGLSLKEPDTSISAFVRELIAVHKFYERPEE